VQIISTTFLQEFRDVLAEITSDLGGADLLSEGQRQLARPAATISIACERMEGEAAASNAIAISMCSAPRRQTATPSASSSSGGFGAR
jgi:hypothetical protein